MPTSLVLERFDILRTAHTEHYELVANRNTAMADAKAASPESALYLSRSETQPRALTACVKYLIPIPVGRRFA
jgi:hypothetical protein